jgi:hypothetical protein
MRLTPLHATLGFALLLSPALAAQTLGQLDQQDYTFEETEDGWILAADAGGTHVFGSFQEYVGSSFFLDHGLRCGTDRLFLPEIQLPDATGDCNSSHTSILSQYNPQPTPYVIPVWVHILRNNTGSLGNVSQSQITSQITTLNNAFASAGVQFVLAGQDTSNNTKWYNDRGTYYNTLAQDVNNYLNIYTNLAGGNLGYAYVPSGGGVVGNKFDRVVIYYRAFGNPGTYGAPYNEGDTTVHEVGHYLGLYHTFQGGCQSASNCSNNGDLICDTNPEGSPNFSPCTRQSACGSWLDPTTNFMDYSDDVCMFQFSSNQMNRMNCTIQNFRTRIPNNVP